MSPLDPAIRPYVSVHRIDDPDAHARMLVQLMPEWTDSTSVVFLECPDCQLRFSPRRVDSYWECSCPSCLQDAASTEDGVMPPRGFGETPLEAAGDWEVNR